jgi:hypothetical protein
MSFISGTDATATTPPVNERKHIRALRAALQAELLQAKREGYFGSIAKYLMRTEVHTFAFSVAANVILSFFPFVILLLTLTRQVFHSTGMYDVVLQVLR